MICIGEHIYIVGQIKVTVATEEQRSALHCHGLLEIFSRLFKGGTIYHLTSFSRGTRGKWDNTVCIYSTSEKQRNFGRIETFVNTSPPQALIRTLSHSQESILQQAGPPFKPALALYKDVDLLATFIHVLDIKTYM